MRALAALGVLAFCAPALAADVSVRTPSMKAPLSLDRSYRNGLALDARGDHAAAAEAFRAAATRGRVVRAEFHLKLSAAIAKLREAVQRAPDSYEDHFNLGVNLQNKYWGLVLDLGIRNHRLFLLAEHHFKEAMRLMPRAANPLICLAALYAQAGDRARALETIRGLSSRPTRPGDLYNLAFYHKVMGDLDEAYRVLKQAFQHDARHREWVRESDDFAELRDDPRLKALMEEAPGPSLWTPLRRLRLPGTGIGRLKWHRLPPPVLKPSPSPPPGP
jgi:tetratricopeptide (TPR) repeat protein